MSVSKPVAWAVVVLAAIGCKQGKGAPCEQHIDCEENLICCVPQSLTRGVCEVMEECDSTGGTATGQAGTGSLADSGTSTGSAGQPDASLDAARTPDSAVDARTGDGAGTDPGPTDAGDASRRDSASSKDAASDAGSDA